MLAPAPTPRSGLWRRLNPLCQSPLAEPAVHRYQQLIRLAVLAVLLPPARQASGGTGDTSACRRGTDSGSGPTNPLAKKSAHRKRAAGGDGNTQIRFAVATLQLQIQTTLRVLAGWLRSGTLEPEGRVQERP